MLIGIIALLLLVLLAAAGWFLSAVVARPKYFSLEDARKIEQDSGVYGDYDRLDKTDYVISSFDGYQLHATFIPAAQDSKRYMIITHGYGYNRMGSVKYVHLFRSMGFHCVIYDSRGHGENVRTVNTMGKIEHRDLLKVIDDTYARYGQDIEIGLHGESMGSALSVMALGEKPRVSFLISDCGYADLAKILSDQLRKQYHLPQWLVYPASLMSKLRFGFSYGEVVPWKALVENDIPVLFIHGEADTFIIPEHARIMYARDAGPKELLLIPGAEHARSLVTAPEEYTRHVRAFIEGLAEGKQQTH